MKPLHNKKESEEKSRIMKYIFGNIENIYYESMKFYEALKLCGYDHEKIAKVFINSVSNAMQY